MKKPTIGMNDLLEALHQFAKPKERRPDGPGWWTMDELAEHEGIGRYAMRYQLAKARRHGLIMETATGSTVTTDGLLKRATFYRLKRVAPTQRRH